MKKFYNTPNKLLSQASTRTITTNVYGPTSFISVPANGIDPVVLPPLSVPVSSGVACPPVKLTAPLPRPSSVHTVEYVDNVVLPPLVPLSSGVAGPSVKPAASLPPPRPSSVHTVNTVVLPPLVPLSSGVAGPSVKPAASLPPPRPSSVHTVECVDTMVLPSTAKNRAEKSTYASKSPPRKAKRTRNKPAPTPSVANVGSSASAVLYCSTNPLPGLPDMSGMPCMEDCEPFSPEPFEAKRKTSAVVKKTKHLSTTMVNMAMNDAELGCLLVDADDLTNFPPISPMTTNALYSSQLDNERTECDLNTPHSSSALNAPEAMILLRDVATKADTNMLLREIRNLRQYVEHSVQSGVIGPAPQEHIQQFEFSPLKDRTELEEFDKRLESDEENKKNILQYILRESGDTRIHYILHSAIDIVFSKTLFAHCCWTGINKGSKKIALMDFGNVLHIFKTLGNLSDTQVRDLFKQKNKNAKRRQTLSGEKNQPLLRQLKSLRQMLQQRMIELLAPYTI
ncbi:uncharacterized protein LOC133391391 [Anopheles gambiae]|uniref:uncharacterized protein LOC133391391 n=1 Tax=Anopheles gambiae TaxID=7165 RepID=UPI002AC89A55|nr:uncharacterized protein LOC133391391 [Anopheles gambiae]